MVLNNIKQVIFWFMINYLTSHCMTKPIYALTNFPDSVEIYWSLSLLLNSIIKTKVDRVKPS